MSHTLAALRNDTANNQEIKLTGRGSAAESNFVFLLSNSSLFFNKKQTPSQKNPKTPQLNTSESTKHSGP